MDNYDHIRDLWTTINRHFERDDKSIPTAQKRRANEWLSRHEAILAVAERADGYEEFVLSYIQREQSRLRDGRRQRDRPVCTCENINCPLKLGRLPRQIREADAVDDGIQDFRTGQRHQGEPRVLTEAQEAYAELMTATGEILREAITVLTADDEEPRDDPVTLSSETADALDVDADDLPTEAASA